MITKRPEIKAVSLERLLELYPEGNKTDTLTNTVDGYLAIRQNTIDELVGRFSDLELAALIQATAGVQPCKPVQGDTETFLKILSQSSIDLNGMESEAFFEGLVSKIRSLTAAQVYFLQEELFRFFHVPSAFRNQEDFYAQL